MSLPPPRPASSPAIGRLLHLVLVLTLVPLGMLVAAQQPATAGHLDSNAVMSDVVVGDGHVCALSTGGAVWCWGDNTFGQLGRGSDVANDWRPGLVPGLVGVTALAAGAHHTCAVLGEGGQVACWGRNDSGQLGDGTTTQTNVPVVAEGVTGATMVAAGRAHTCAVTGQEPDQEVWCWGANGFGQLGLGSVNDAALDYGVLSNGVAVGLFLGHDSVASDEAGRVFSSTRNARVYEFDEDGNTEQYWRVGSGTPPGGALAPTGDGGTWAADPRGGSPLLYRLFANGAVGPPTDVTDPLMGCTGDLCRLVGLAPTPGGGVVAGVVRDSAPPVSWLRRYDAAGAPVGAPVKVPNTTGPVTDLAASRNETGTATSVFALDGERVVRFTTSLTYVSEFSLHQVGDDCAIRDDYSATSQDVAADPTKADWTFTRRLSDFQHSRFGTGDDGYLSVLLQYDLITRTLTQRLDKEPVPEIPEDSGQYVDAPGSPAPQPLCLATADAFGAGAGTLTEVPTSAAVGTDLHASMDVTGLPDGGFAVSDDDEGSKGPRLSRLVRITGGGGDVAGWGRVSFRSIPAPSAPARIWRDGLNVNSLGTDEITSLAAGRHHTCIGVNQDGYQTFGCWGADGSGQVSSAADPFSSLSLGRAPAVTGDQTSFPVRFTIYDNRSIYGGPVFAGGNQTCQLRPDDLICMGANDAGQLGIAPPLGGYVTTALTGSDVAVGARHTCVVVPASAAGVECWGANESFQLGSTDPDGSPVSLPGATAVSAGRATTCAVKDGDVWCWGSREDGQIADPSPQPIPSPVAIGFFPGVDAVVAGPAGLDDPATVTFGLPADGVTASNLALRSTTSGLPEAATVTCRGDDGSVVDCADGVAMAELRPVGGWMPGGHYALEVNPDGAAPVTVSGVPVTADPGEFRAATSVDVVTPTAESAWAVARARKALDGTYLRERTAGATLSVAFRGPKLRLVTPSGPKFGKATVQVDTQEPLVIDLWAPKPRQQLVHEILRVGRGQHTVTLTALGKANRRARDTFVGLDGLQVRSGVVGSPVVEQAWASEPDGGAGAVLRSRCRGATWQLEFEGTGVSWYGPSGPDEGEAKVYVDGVEMQLVSGYAEAPGTVVHTVDGLTDGRHTLAVVVQGRGPGSSDRVSIDGAEIQ